MKRQGIWENVVIVMGSDFGRSITPNSGGGTDHAWGGNYFLIGGGVDGGKILGTYPEHLTDKSSQWILRGRLVPTTPWDSVWNGIANWMGVRGDTDLDYLLPNRFNFDRCAMFTDQDLFTDGQVPHSSCLQKDADGDGVSDDVDECPNTKYWYGLQANNVGCLPGVGEPTAAPTASSLTPTKTPKVTCVRMKVKETGTYLSGGFADHMLSTRPQTDIENTEFLLDKQTDGSVMIKVKGSNLYLNENKTPGDQFISTRTLNKGGNTRFYLEKELSDSSYQIQVQENALYWHADDGRKGNKLVSTLWQSGDGFAKFYFEECSTNPPVSEPTTVTEKPSAPITGSPVRVPTSPTTDSPAGVPSVPTTDSPVGVPTVPTTDSPVTTKPTNEQTSCIRMKVKKTKLYLYVGRDDKLLSTIVQDSEEYSRFQLVEQSDGSHQIMLKATSLYLNENRKPGDQFISTRSLDNGGNKFILEQQDNDSYRIKVQDSRLYWHNDGGKRGDKLITTRYQSTDSYSMFYIENCPSDSPVSAPTKVTENPSVPTTDSPVGVTSIPTTDSPVGVPSVPTTISPVRIISPTSQPTKTTKPTNEQTSCIRMKLEADQSYLYVGRDNDHMLSNIVQVDDDYSKFQLDLQIDGSYRIMVKATNFYLRESRDTFISAQFSEDSRNTRFVFENVAVDSYQIKNQENGLYWHCNAGRRGDNLVSTRYQSFDDYAKFHFEDCSITDSPVEFPTVHPRIMPTPIPIAAAPVTTSPSLYRPSGQPTAEVLITAKPTGKQMSCVRMKVKATGSYLSEGRHNSFLSALSQTGYDYTRFLLELQIDGSYKIIVIATNSYLNEFSSGDKIISTRSLGNKGNDKFNLEIQTDGSYRIQVKANAKYLHCDDARKGDKLVSTRYQINDSYTKFFFEECSTNSPISVPTTTDSPVKTPAPNPTVIPSSIPTPAPVTTAPTRSLTGFPSLMPSLNPTAVQSFIPTSAPATTEPTKSSTGFPSSTSSSNPTALTSTPTTAPTELITELTTPTPDPCAGLKLSKCNKISQVCIYSKSKKVWGPCLAKVKKFEYNCLQHTTKDLCDSKDKKGVCKFQGGVCTHRCDGIEPKVTCKKVRNPLKKVKMCNMRKIPNPCKGCHPKSQCL